MNYIDVEKTITGAPHLKSDHFDVFSCSMGDNPIHYMGHVKMMSAVQPFISGAISKTVNMPEEVKVEEIEQLHIEAWKLGLKAVAIYRDNCKVAQPLSMTKKGADKNNDLPGLGVEAVTEKVIVKSVVRREMPKVRPSKTYSFTVSDCHGYFTVGEYEDGTPGELFVRVAKMGSTLAGLMDSFARSISYSLQYGVPLKVYVKGMTSMSFAPAGITDDPEIRTASSLIDYIFRRLAMDYLSFDDRLELGLASIDDMPDEQTSMLDMEILPDTTITSEQKVAVQPAKVEAKPEKVVATSKHRDQSAPMCFNCGNQTQKAGSCYVCSSCGSTTGCS